MGWKDSAIPVTQNSSAPSWKDSAIPVQVEQNALDKSFMGMTPRGLIQGTLNVLPAAGAFGGGLMGGAAGTVIEPGGGTVVGASGGAALGGAAGAHLKELGEQYLLGQDKKSGDYLKADAKGAKGGAEQELGGQIGAKALKAIAETPGLLRAIADGPTQKAEGLIYDPFLKTERLPGQPVEELQNLGTTINKGEADPSFIQNAARTGVDAINKTKDIAGKTVDVAGNILPYAAKITGAALGHFPGYATAEALTSPLGKSAMKSTGLIMKDAAGNIVASPEGLGLLLKEASGKKASNRKSNIQ